MIQRGLILLILVGCVACGYSGSIAQPPTPTDEGEPFSYAMYNSLLEKYVDDRGFVDYAGLQNDRAPLDRFVNMMGALPESELNAWSEDERLAFWINAYNAITLQYIINHYPIEKGGLVSGLLYPANSIRQIHGVWEKLETVVAGTPITLDAIEHQILRKEFSEPRIHMAIVCASVGCPPLRSEAFVAEKLGEQLDDQSRQFLSDSGKLHIDRASETVYLSPIFDWFGEDFVPGYSPDDGSFSEQSTKLAAVLNFISQYVSDSDAAYLAQGGYSVNFAEYDWSLNDQ